VDFRFVFFCDVHKPEETQAAPPVLLYAEYCREAFLSCKAAAATLYMLECIFKLL
jgi:hypothetical protein